VSTLARFASQRVIVVAKLEAAKLEVAKLVSPPVIEMALRVGGTIVAMWGSVLLALIGAFLTPVRVGGVLVPVSVLIAIVANVGLMRFAYVTTRHRGLAVLPGVVWIVLAFMATSGTSEGDIVLTSNNWVGPVYLLTGSATVAVCAYRLLPRQAPAAGPGASIMN